MFTFLKKQKKNPGQKLRSLLGKFELPSFNTTVMKVLSMLRDPDSSIKDIAGQVQIDPGMHVKTLRAVNAAAFGLASKVSNIQHAVTLLGRSRLESVIISIAVRDALPEIQSPHLDARRFWETASERACLAGALAGCLHPSTKTESFISALLQDMAIPVIMHANRQRYTVVLEQWFASKESMLDKIEEKALGYDHAVIGALMAEEWNLPEYVVKAIGGHHGENGDGNAEAAVKLVSHLRYVDEDKVSALREKCMTEYEMDAHRLDEMIQKAFEDASQFRM